MELAVCLGCLTVWVGWLVDSFVWFGMGWVGWVWFVCAPDGISLNFSSEKISKKDPRGVPEPLQIEQRQRKFGGPSTSQTSLARRNARSDSAAPCRRARRNAKSCTESCKIPALIQSWCRVRTEPCKTRRVLTLLTSRRPRALRRAAPF